MSAEELALHNAPHDCWVGVHSRVLNVTQFKDVHPGGKAVFVCGADITEAYQAQHGGPETVSARLETA